jgi:transposase
MSKKITIPPKEEILELYSKEGCTISSLSKHYSTSNPTVRSWLVKYGIERKTHKQASTEANNRHRKTVKPSVNTLIELYSDNSQFELAKLFEVTQSTVNEWLEEYNIKNTHSEMCIKGKNKQHSEIRYTKKEVENAYDRTKPLLYTAKKLNISTSYLKTLFKKYNIEAEKPWRSNAEINLYEYLTKEYPHLKFDHSNKDLIYPYELDIVCHDSKIAIEYCGLYWHSEVSGKKEKFYHKRKYDMCKSLGYKLITIFESDNLDKIKFLFKTIFKNKKRIYARNTIVKEITSSEASSFNNSHHLHDSVGGKYHFGLFYDDLLVMCVSFSKTRFNKKYEYECARMTSHSDYSVVGGASKMFSYFVKEKQPKSIITYADLRFGDGNVYTHCNFERLKDSDPNYWYHNRNGILYSRVKFQKHKLKSQLDVFYPEFTEFENMKMNGWDRIWDCGNAVYIWK